MEVIFDELKDKVENADTISLDLLAEFTGLKKEVLKNNLNFNESNEISKDQLKSQVGNLAQEVFKPHLS